MYGTESSFFFCQILLKNFECPLNQKIIFLTVRMSYHSNTNHNRNTKFDLLHLYFIQMLLEIFMEVEQIVCVQGHTKYSKTFRQCTEYLISTFFDAFRKHSIRQNEHTFLRQSKACNQQNMACSSSTSRLHGYVKEMSYISDYYETWMKIHFELFY